MKFKDYYDADCAKLLADKLSAVDASFDGRRFVRLVRRAVPDLEFLDRQDAFVDAFEKTLGDDVVDNLDRFERILGPELEEAEGMFKHGYWLWPVGRYVERHGTVDIPRSMAFLYELTKRFTGEFGVRPLLDADPTACLKTMRTWSADPNVHVRRLSSEGLRVKLPWAKKLTVALEHPTAVGRILGNLRHDPERFVQKSVGNNLNDLMKVDPDLANRIIDRWEAGRMTDATRWIIRHGRRSLR